MRWRRGWTPAEHRRGVDQIRQRIGAGDCFQCNYTVRLHGQFRGDTHALYTDLAAGQRGADNAYLDLGRFVIASASPELFFLRAGDDVLVRPMKGAAPRGRTRPRTCRRPRTCAPVSRNAPRTSSSST